MKKRFSWSVLFLTMAVFTACDPNDDSGNRNNNGNNPSDEEFRENFGSEVTRDFFGQVVNVNNEPIQGATVKIGSMTVQTDQNGVFMANGASVYQKFAYIKVSKPGYIDGSRVLVPTAGRNNVKIMLVESAALETIQAGEESEVSISSGTKVQFDGSFEDAQGNPYSGAVSVSMFHLTPSNEHLSELQPGMLYAQTQTGDQAVLQTFGMLNVELRGSSGQKLQVADGHTAQITMSIDNLQMASAPNSIPLWHFDEDAGWWKEDGQATKQGNYYVGEVSHFSWWNVDVPFSLTALHATVVDQDQNPLPNIMVKVTSGNGSAMSGVSDENGNVSVPVPVNQALTVSVIGICGDVVHTQPFAAISAETSIGEIAVNAGTSLKTVTGNLVNCDSEVVENGYVTLYYGDYTAFAVVNGGSFSFSILACDTLSTFGLQGIDYSDSQATDDSGFVFTGQSTNVGSLIACSGIAEYVTFQVDNDAPMVFLNDVRYSAGLRGTNSQGEFLMQVPIAQPGTWEGLIGGKIYAPGINISFYPEFVNNTIIATTTSMQQSGGYYDIYFSGTFEKDGVVHTYSGTGHAIVE